MRSASCRSAAACCSAAPRPVPQWGLRCRSKRGRRLPGGRQRRPTEALPPRVARSPLHRLGQITTGYSRPLLRWMVTTAIADSAASLRQRWASATSRSSCRRRLRSQSAVAAAFSPWRCICSCTSSAACCRSARARPRRASRARASLPSSWPTTAVSPCCGSRSASRARLSASWSQASGGALRIRSALQPSRLEAASRRSSPGSPAAARASSSRCRARAPSLANTSPWFTSRLGRPRRSRAIRRASASRWVFTSRQRSAGSSGRRLSPFTSCNWRSSRPWQKAATWLSSWAGSTASSCRGASSAGSVSCSPRARQSTSGTSRSELKRPGRMRAFSPAIRPALERRFSTSS